MEKINKMCLTTLIMFIFAGSVVFSQTGNGKQPDVKIDVKKELDEKGNVKRYDSTYTFSWSGNRNVNIDSIFRSLNENFGFSPFTDSFSGRPGTDVNRKKNSDSLSYINPNDSVYHFRSPGNIFDLPFYQPFDFSTIDKFFNDSFFSDDFFNPQNMIEKHMKMMEELRKNIENNPQFQAVPDSVPGTPNQRFIAPPPKRNQPKGLEI
jgi:hypothetical protein